METLFVLLVIVAVAWYLGLLSLGRKASDSAASAANLALDRWVEDSAKRHANSAGEAITAEQLEAIQERAARADQIRDLLR